jgi:hypothetical protein
MLDTLQTDSIMRSLRHLVIAAACATLAPTVVHAQFLQYTTLAAWQASVLTPGVDTFNDLAFGAVAAPLARTAGSVTYQAGVSAPATSFYNVGPATDRWLSTVGVADTITFTSFSTPIRAIAGNFFGTDGPGAALPSATIRVWATSATGTSTFTLNNTTTSSFFGLTSTSNITSLRIAAVQPATPVYVTANDLRVSTAVVPEPATVLLLGAGLIVLGGALRQRSTY